jgi:hypothetical protein
VVLGVCFVWEWLVHDADHLSPSSAAVDNEWRYSPTLLLCLHCTHQGTLSVTSVSTHLVALSMWPYYWNIFHNKRPLHTMSRSLLALSSLVYVIIRLNSTKLMCDLYACLVPITTNVNIHKNT